MSVTFSRLFRKIYRIGLILGIVFAVSLAQPMYAEEDQTEEAAENQTENTPDGAAESQVSKRLVDPIHHMEECLAVLYDNTNGLPTSEANDLLQSKDGVIWIGSYGGLVRYDGKTFERYDSTTGITSVVDLLLDKEDRLWICTNDNGLAMLDDEVLRMWGEADGLKSSKTCAAAEDENGIIYIATTKGMVIVRPDLSLETLDDPLIADAYIERAERGCDGVIYCLTMDNDFFSLKDGQLTAYIDHTEDIMRGITDIFPDQQAAGYFYMETEDNTFYHGKLTELPDQWEIIDISPLANVMSVTLIEDQLWICARNGIGVIEENSFYYLQELPLNNAVGHAMVDYEGNLWFTSQHQGIMKIVGDQFADVFALYGIEQNVVNSTCMSDGNLFVGTDTGLLVLGSDRVVTELPLTEAKTASGEDLEVYDLIELLEGCRIRSIIRDSAGRLWISSWRSRGLVRYDHGRVMTFSESDGLLSDYVRVVCETSDGKFLVVASGGLNVIEGDRITAAYGKEDGIINTENLTVCEASNGDYILGSNGDGIYIINGEGVRNIGRSDGLESDIVMRVKKDRTRDIYWIVTSNSIAFMDEDYQVTTIQTFPYANNFDLYQNSQDEMWVLSSNGAYVLPTATMLADEDLHPVHFDLAYGMPCTPISNSYSELTDSGDLYICGNTGVARVNIDTSKEDVTDLIMAVPYIQANEDYYLPDDDGNFTIPSNIKKLVIYGYVYTSSLTNPQVSFCLEGFDNDFTTVNRSELSPVTYTNLRGGTYRFVMELRSYTGRVSRTLSVSIVKVKALTEHLWFNILIAIAIIILGLLVVHLYVRKKRRDMEKRHTEELEKERLGTELKTATHIQERMLPHEFPPFPDRKEFDIFASMDPAREVGGDFYDFFFIDEDHLCLVIADVSGKGIPAALFMMISKVILQNYAMLDGNPAKILAMSNETTCANNPSDFFVTVWLGILEVSTGTVRAANAGHEYPALMKGGVFSLMKDPHGLVVGGMEGVKYKEYQFTLEPGDKLFVYTDGVPEATSAENELFGTDRMLEALNSDPKADSEQILKNVRSAVDAFVKDAEQFDDLTMLCLEYHGPAE